MNNKSCKYCDEPVNRKKLGIQCSGFCARFVHGECVNIVGQSLDAIRMQGVRWECEQCRLSSANTVRPRTSFGGTGGAAPIHSVPSYSNDVLDAIQDMRGQMRQVHEQQSALMPCNSDD